MARSGSAAIRSSIISVPIGPMTTQLALMLWRPMPRATERTEAGSGLRARVDLHARVAPAPGVGVVVTTLPFLRSIMPGSAAAVQLITPSKFTPMKVFQVSGPVS